MSPKDVAEEDVRDLAEKFDVEAFVETASDGKTAILVFHQDGEPVAYNDTEDMYQDLASRQEKMKRLAAMKLARVICSKFTTAYVKTRPTEKILQ